MNAFEQKLGLHTESDRVIHRFNIPASVPGEIRSLGMVEITAHEEMQAEQRCKGASDKRAQEMAKQSIVEVNGEPVRIGDGSVDKAWNNMHPKVRTLVASAWVRLHLANDAEVESFFASRTSTV
jgi:hypothetical protein